MIIYGFRDREAVAGAGEFPCPCCKVQRPYALISVRRWFTLYFLPLFPLYSRGRFVKCYTCAQTFGEEYAFGANPFQENGNGPPVHPLAATPFPVAQVAPGTPHPAMYETAPSPALSITTLLFGILSPFFFLACGASIFTSLIAVICGHLSLRIKPDSMGRTGGRGMAIAGLVLGYIFLLLSPVAIYGAYQVFRNAANAPAQIGDDKIASVGDGPGAERLKAIERRVMTKAKGVAQGNTEAAQAIAAEFSDAMGKIREVAITKNEKKGIQLTGGHFVTYCELREGACTIVVHVPEFRNYTDDAKKFICEMGWIAAQDCAAKEIGLSGDLALGMKGVLNYGGVMTGTCNGPAKHSEVADSADESQLAAFLEKVRALKAGKADELVAANTSTTSIEVAPPETQPGETGSLTTEPSTTEPSTTEHSTSRPSTTEPLAMAPSTPPPSITPPSVTSSPDETNPFETAPVPTTSSAAPTTPSEENPFAGTAATPPASSSPSAVAPGLDSGKRNEPIVPAGPIPVIEKLVPISVANEIGGARALAVSPDGNYLAVAFEQQRLAIYDLKTNGKRVEGKQPQASLGISAMHFSQNNQRLFTGGDAGDLLAFEFKPRSSLLLKTTLTSHAGKITCLATRGEATFLVAGSMQGGLTWQQIRENKPGEVRNVDRGAQSISEVKAIHLPEDGLDFFATDGKQILQVDMKTGQIKSAKLLPTSFAAEFGFSSDGKQLATHSILGLHIFDVETGKVIVEHKAQNLAGPICYVPGQHRILVSNGAAVAFFDAQRGYLTKLDLATSQLSMISRVHTISASSNGSVVAIATRSGEKIDLFSIHPDEAPAEK